MKINCPINNKEEVIPLIKAGADIFYAGVDSEVLFGDSGGITNRRPWKNSNFNSLEDLRKTTEIIHKYNKKIWITLNEHIYSDEQVNKILTFISKTKFINAYIVTDINLIIKLIKTYPGIKLVASTGTHTQNKNTVQFYRDLGVLSVILPRHLNLSEINEIVESNTSIEFECFIKNEDCPNIDGLCTYSHGIFQVNSGLEACRLLSDFKVITKDIKTKNMVFKRLNSYKELLINRCGACAIPNLFKSGVGIVKIVGRGKPTKEKIKDVVFIKKAISKLDLENNDFVKGVKKDYIMIYGKKCNNRCFY